MIVEAVVLCVAKCLCILETNKSLNSWNTSEYSMFIQCEYSVLLEISKFLVTHSQRGLTIMSVSGFWKLFGIDTVMRRSNCSAPIPRAPPGTSLFGGCPGLLITLFFPCPALYKHSNHSFFQCHALIYHTHFSSDPGAAPRGGWGQNNLTGALKEYIDNFNLNAPVKLFCPHPQNNYTAIVCGLLLFSFFDHVIV